MSVKVNRASIERAEALVSRIRLKLEATRIAKEKAWTEIRESNLAVEEGSKSAEAALLKARKTHENARGAEIELEATLADVESKYQAELAALKAAERLKRWADTGDVTGSVRDLAKRLEDHSVEGAKLKAELKAKCLSAYKLAPMTEMAFDACPLGDDQVEGWFQAYFRKVERIERGLSTSEDHSVPPFSQKIDEGCAWLLKFRPKPETEVLA